MKELERIITIINRMSKKRTIATLLLSLISIGVTAPLAQANSPVSALMLDFFVDSNNWDIQGNVRVEPGDTITNPRSTGTMIFQPNQTAPVASARIASYGGRSIPYQDEYALNFEFSLSDFTVGDTWEVDYRTYEDGRVDFLRCGIKDYPGDDEPGIDCRTGQRDPQGQEELGLADYNHYLAYRDGKHFVATIAELNHALLIRVYDPDVQDRYFLANYGAAMRDREIALTHAHPIFMINETMLTHPGQTSFNLHWVSYTPAGYVLDLNIHHMMQTSETWKNILLGHSQTATIGDYGCLLTSLTMLLHSYGYYQFPDGTQLTVASLNEWLKSQPDGFINKTYLNLASIARLSNQLHEHYVALGMTFPKFEYRYEPTPSLYDTASIPIMRYEPYIQEVRGHFVVVSGVNYAEYGPRIADPYYSRRTRLSDYSGTLISRRRLIPSFTDQSYLIVNVIGQADVLLEDHEHNTIYGEKAPFYDLDTGEVTGYQYLLAKPASGDYNLYLNSQDPSSTFSFFAYNTSGNVATYHPETLRVGEDGISLSLSYDREASAAADILTYTEADDWTLIQHDSRWTYHFVRLIINRYYQDGQYLLLKELAKDYLDRGLLDNGLYERINAHLQTIG